MTTYSHFITNDMPTRNDRETFTDLIDRELGRTITLSIRSNFSENSKKESVVKFGFKVDNKYLDSLNKKFIKIIGTESFLVLANYKINNVKITNIAEDKYLEYFPIYPILPEKLYFLISVHSMTPFLYPFLIFEAYKHFSQDIVSTIKFYGNVDNKYLNGFWCSFGIKCDTDYIGSDLRDIYDSDEKYIFPSEIYGFQMIASNFTEDKYNTLSASTDFILQDSSKKDGYITSSDVEKSVEEKNIEEKSIEEKNMEEEIEKLKAIIRMRQLQKEIDELSAQLEQEK